MNLSMKMIKLAFTGLLLLLAPGCVLVPGDVYIVMEGGYQEVETSEKISGGGEGVFEHNDYTYGAALGYGLSLVNLYVGGELGFAYTSFKDDLAIKGIGARERDRFPTARVEENFILSAVGDAGFYPMRDLLLFGRAGYVYVDRDIAITPATGLDPIRVPIADELSTFAFGGGAEYNIGLGLGVRATYLRHEGERDADDIRVGIVWRWF